MGGVYKPRLKKAKVGSIDPTTGFSCTTYRGLTRLEVKAMLNAPFDVLPPHPTPNQVERAERDHLIIVLLWESWARLQELLGVDVQDLDLTNRIMVIRRAKAKVKRDRSGGRYSEVLERETGFSEETKRKLIKYLNGRKKGSLFPLKARAVRLMIHDYAAAKKIQKVVGYTAKREPRFLITPKAFREAGEFFSSVDGMDDGVAAQRAGHTRAVQEKNYKKYDGIRAQELADRHLPRL